MAAQKRSTRRTAKKAIPRRSPRGVQQARTVGLMDYFRFGESYTSLVLGIVVVIIVTILLLSLFKTRTTHIDTQRETSSMKTDVINNVQERQKSDNQDESTRNEQKEKVYTVKSGDDLWKIAEREYNDGYKWNLIAKVNNLTNPEIIHVGNKLVLPSITPTGTMKVSKSSTSFQSSPVSSTEKITGNSYTVVRGDYLWDIAVRAYGDGYRWVDIARENNLAQPDIIHPGNILKIPR